MRAHIIVDGVVVNTAVVQSLDALPGFMLIDADLRGGSIGDVWDGSALVRPQVDLVALKAAKNLEINEARLAATYSTFPHAGKVFSCDPLSRSDIDGINGYVALNAALPAAWPGAWKAVDNTFLEIPDVAAWTAFYTAMVNTGNGNFAHSQALKQQLANATSESDVTAIHW